MEGLERGGCDISRPFTDRIVQLTIGSIILDSQVFPVWVSARRGRCLAHDSTMATDACATIS
jgi:hypothetical protein